jgi:hypothetical protein
MYVDCEKCQKKAHNVKHIAQIIWAIFFKNKCAQRQNGKILPNLVTLIMKEDERKISVYTNRRLSQSWNSPQNDSHKNNLRLIF